MKFSLASEQKVNYSKSQIFFSANIYDEVANYLSKLAEIPLTKDLGKYLGVPLINQSKSKATYTELLDRFNKKMPG